MQLPAEFLQEKGSPGYNSLLPAQSQDCVGKLGTCCGFVCSAAELAFASYMCWFGKQTERSSIFFKACSIFDFSCWVQELCEWVA